MKPASASAMLVACFLSSVHAGTLNVTQPRILTGPNPYPCNTSFVCMTDVTVGPGFVDDKGVFQPDGCHVRWGYSGYVVAQRQKPRLRWRLVKDDPNDRDKYRFDSMTGIRLNPDDQNDPSQDLHSPGHDAGDTKTFVWQDRNKRKREGDPAEPVQARAIRFDFVVFRKSDGKQCKAGDPVVINRGE